jgi:hypothetical protein
MDGEAGGGAGPLESPQERRERWRSVYVIYFTMFQMSLGFSIVLTGVWPYLDKVSAHHQFCRPLQSNQPLNIPPSTVFNCTAQLPYHHLSIST